MGGWTDDTLVVQHLQVSRINATGNNTDRFEGKNEQPG